MIKIKNKARGTTTRQRLGRTDLVLVAADERRFFRAGRKCQDAAGDLLVQMVAARLHHVDLGVLVLLVEDHVADEHRILGLDDHGPPNEADLCQLFQRHLCPARAGDQNTTELFE